MTRWFALLWLLAATWVLSEPAAAHKPSDSYLTVRLAESGATGRWDIALRDLDFAIGLDSDQDAALTWGEVVARHEDIAAYALARLELSVDGASCITRAGDQLIEDHSDGAYTVVLFAIDCPVPVKALTLDYRLFFDLDPLHRGLLSLEAGGEVVTAVLSPDSPALTWQPGGPGALDAFLSYLRDGVWHIWIGFDHLLFLVTLLLPVFWRRAADSLDSGRPSLRSVLLSVLKVVTAFSLAHSITLTAGALSWVALPSRFVETAIAASILIAAANTLWPFVTRRLWLLAFVFGLIHGFGFAAVLADLGLPAGTLLAALLAFNIGVELGQLAVVAAVVPLLYCVARYRLYDRVLVPSGTALVILIAGAWFFERLLDLSLLPI